MSTTTTPPTGGGTVVTITNSLTFAVDIYDVFNPATGTAPMPYVYTSLGTIQPGATGTVTTIRDIAMLQAMYTGSIAALGPLTYEQFPIKVMSGTQFDFSTPPPSPLAYTIAQADVDAMTQSFQFHQFILANPNSPITTGLTTALQSGVMDTINQYFATASGSSYASVTIQSWNAVMNWLQMFFSGWQGSYYLYQSPATSSSGNSSSGSSSSTASSGSSSSSTASGPPALVGVITISATSATSPQAQLSICSANTDGSPNYPSPTQLTTLVMVGDGTMADSSPGTDSSTSLTPVWMYEQPTDGSSPASTTLVVSLTGTISNVTVFSSGSTIGGTSEWSQIGSTLLSIWSVVSNIAQTLANMAMLYEFCSKMFGSNESQKEASKKAATDPTDAQQKADAIDSGSGSAIKEQVNNDQSAINDNGQKVAAQNDQIKDLNNQENDEEEVESQLGNEENQLDQTIEDDMEEGAPPTENMEQSDTNFKAGVQNVQQDVSSGNLQKAGTDMQNLGNQENQIVENANQEKEGDVAELQQGQEVVEDDEADWEDVNEDEEEIQNDEKEESEDGDNEEGEGEGDA